MIDVNGARLLTPIEVSAVLVGAPPSKNFYSAFSYDFTSIGDDPLGQHIESPLFQDQDPDSPPDPGAYLLWGLPESLVHGVQNPKTGEITYPALPNRWLVTRLWCAGGEKSVHTKSFVVQSDQLQLDCGDASYNRNSPTVPYTKEDPDQPYRYLGRAFAAQQDPAVLPDGKAVLLNAGTLTNPFFTAYMPMCRNVFAFYDDLTALNKVYVSYLVCGWYQDAVGADPLLDIHDLQTLEEQLQFTVDTTVWPQGMLCHGMTSNLEWVDSDTRYPSGVPSDPEPGQPEVKPKLAVGNTSSEALAVLTGRENCDQERLYHLFLQDALPAVTERADLGSTEDALHQSAFTTIKPPDVTGMKRVSNDADTPIPSEQSMDALSQLRQGQRQLYQLYTKFLQAQRAAFETWYLYACSDDDYRTKYLRRLQKQVEALPGLQKALEAKVESIENDAKALEVPAYTQVDEPDPAYFCPNDPVVLLSQLTEQGIDAINAPRQSETGLLMCRTSGNTVSKLHLTVQERPVAIPGKAVTEAPQVHPDNVPEELLAEIAELLGETVLLSQGFAEVLARYALKEAGIPNPDATLRNLIVDKIRQSQPPEGGGDPSAFDGVFPDPISVTPYTPHWRPLFLEWRVFYYPDMQLLQETPDLSNWCFEDGEYTYTGDEGIISVENEYVLEGRLLISDNASMRLENAIERYLSNSDEILLTRARQTTLLSQALGGFHDSLLMKQNAIPLALFSSDPEEQAILKIISSLSPDILNTRPLFDSLYAPIRGGFFSLQELRIIDNFGRFQDLDQPDFYACETMRTPEMPALGHYAMVPLRLAQPARLYSQWICAEPERSRVEGGFPLSASPICGFLLPNRLDDSLMVYTKEGIAVGSLNLTETGSGIKWKSAPGTPISTEIPADINPELYQMLVCLQKRGAKSLSALLTYIHSIYNEIRPRTRPIQDVDLIGHPVVLARAATKLEWLGEREWYRHNDAMDEDPSFENPSRYTRAENALFPVELGRAYDPEDGLLGFYHNEDYTSLYLPGEGPPDSYFIPGNRIALTVCPRREAERFTLLMEPWSPVKLTSGILPAVTLQLPEELVTEALKQISLTYFCAPLLSHGEQLSVPTPAADGLDVYWTHAEGDSWSSTLQAKRDTNAFSDGYPQRVLEGYIRLQRKEDEQP